jgi:hypothetical protein
MNRHEVTFTDSEVHHLSEGKQVGGYTLKCQGSVCYIHNASRVLGKVVKQGGEHVVSTEARGDIIRVEVINAALEFLLECQKVPSTFKCEVEGRFELSGDRVAVYTGGRIYLVGHCDDGSCPPAISQAARKWAGWM